MGSDTDAHTDRQRLPVVVAHGERSEVRVDPFVCTLDAPTQVTHAVSGGEERVMDDAQHTTPVEHGEVNDAGVERVDDVRHRTRLGHTPVGLFLGGDVPNAVDAERRSPHEPRRIRVDAFLKVSDAAVPQSHERGELVEQRLLHGLHEVDEFLVGEGLRADGDGITSGNEVTVLVVVALAARIEPVAGSDAVSTGAVAREHDDRLGPLTGIAVVQAEDYADAADVSDIAVQILPLVVGRSVDATSQPPVPHEQGHVLEAGARRILLHEVRSTPDLAVLDDSEGGTNPHEVGGRGLEEGLSLLQGRGPPLVAEDVEDILPLLGRHGNRLGSLQSSTRETRVLEGAPRRGDGVGTQTPIKESVRVDHLASVSTEGSVVGREVLVERSPRTPPREQQVHEPPRDAEALPRDTVEDHVVDGTGIRLQRRVADHAATGAGLDPRCGRLPQGQVRSGEVTTEHCSPVLVTPDVEVDGTVGRTHVRLQRG